MSGPIAQYIVANGLGNIIQTIPAYLYLRKKYGSVRIVCHPKWQEFTASIYDNIFNKSDRQISTPHHIFSSCNPNYFKTEKISEVEKNLRLVGCQDMRYRKVDTEVTAQMLTSDDLDHADKFDILVCNGYNKRGGIDHWTVKSYSKWEELIEWLSLDGYSVTSIGTRNEYIEGTYDRTEAGLKGTYDLIRQAKLLISNDTGFYHAANVLGTKCIALFTMTDRRKNYDPMFHRNTIAMHTDLACQPCQYNLEPLFWKTNAKVCKWACRNIPVYSIMKKVRELI